MNRIAILSILLLCFHCPSVFSQAYTPQPIGLNYLIQSNPAFTGSRACPYFVLTMVKNHRMSPIQHSLVQASFSSQIDALNGGIGLNLSHDNLNNAYSEQNVNATYAYRLLISRNLAMMLGAKAGYSYLTFDPNQLSAIAQPSALSTKGHLDLGAGLLVYTERLFIGFAMDDFLQPTILNYKGISYQKPLSFSSIVGLNTRIPRLPLSVKWMNSLQQEFRLPIQLLDSNQLLPQQGLHQYTFQSSISKRWLKTGISYRYRVGASNVLGAHLGYTSDALSVVFASGFTQESEVSKVVSTYYQINLDFNFPCKQKRRKYRVMACPSFGGMSYRHGSSQPYGNTNYNSNLNAGTLTAGEVNDFEKWELWNDLSKKELNEQAKVWSIRPEQRYTTQVSNTMGYPVVDAEVTPFIGKQQSDLEGENRQYRKSRIMAQPV